MSRKFSIEVELTDEMVSTHAVVKTYAQNQYKILVSRPQLERHDVRELWVPALHELGHILCTEFEMPVNRPMAERHALNPLAPYNCLFTPAEVLASEEEAWNMAEAIFRAYKEFALDTYRKDLHKR